MLLIRAGSDRDECLNIESNSQQGTFPDPGLQWCFHGFLAGLMNMYPSGNPPRSGKKYYPSVFLA